MPGRASVVRLALVAGVSAFVGGAGWAVSRFWLEVADQTSSVVGGACSVISLTISLYALCSPSQPTPIAAGSGGLVARRWFATAAVDLSLRPPVPAASVRGRERELEVLARLTGRKRGGGLVVVCGGGGMGKTTLAAEAARHAQQAGRAVFWIRWQGEAELLAGQLTRVAQALGLGEQRLEDVRQGRAALVDVVWERLAAVGGWVIVVDNVDTPARVGPGGESVSAYRGWLRPDGAGLLVVTSRDTSAGTWGPRAHLVPLEPLDEEAAGAVLCEAAPAAGSAAEARALAARLGGLPLALRAVGPYLTSPTSRYRTFTAYRHALDTEFGDLLGAPHPRADDPEVARRVVRHTWDLSLDQLHADGYVLARPVLRLLALLEAAPVPRCVLTPELLAEVTEQEATATGVDLALAGLHQYGLITVPATRASDGNHAIQAVGRLVLHPLIREVMALPQAGTDTTAWLAALDAQLARTVEETAQAGRAGWPTARLLAPHLPPLLHRAANFTVARDTLHTLATVLVDAGAGPERLHLHQHLLEATSRQLGSDHPETLDSRNDLAGALSAVGRYEEAVALHRRNLADRERVLGLDHPDTLTSRNNLAQAAASRTRRWPWRRRCFRQCG